MEQYTLDKDITVLCLTASSFPDGIQAAFEKLHAMLHGTEARTSYGISHGSKEGIIYKAAAEEQRPGEAEQYGCERFIIKKGRYIGRIVNWQTQAPLIGETFQTLIADPRIDPKGACIEKYINDTDVQCMVRLKDET